MVAATFGTGQVFWSMLYFFLFFIWVWMLIDIGWMILGMGMLYGIPALVAINVSRVLGVLSPIGLALVIIALGVLLRNARRARAMVIGCDDAARDNEQSEHCKRDSIHRLLLRS